MKILITGAEGQVGRALIKEAHLRFIDIIPYTKANLDISSWTMVMATIKRHQPDLVINAAAYTQVEQAEQDPDLAYKVNRDGVAHLARVCQEENIPLIHISTDYVFSGEKNSPYLETDLPHPLNVYGHSKWEGEKILASLLEKHIILRTSWVFSADGNNFVKTMYRLFHERERVNVVNDQWGGPTSAHCIAHALLTMASFILKEPFQDWGLYHFSGEEATSWYQFAHAIYKACDLKNLALNPIASSDFPTKAKRPMQSVLNMEKIKRIFNISPCNWKKELLTVISLLKENQA